MFIRKKRHRSGNIGVIVVEKIGGKMKELATIGVAYNEDEVENLVNEAKEWISKRPDFVIVSGKSCFARLLIGYFVFFFHRKLYKFMEFSYFCKVF